jgi:hypothetical protein
MSEFEKFIQEAKVSYEKWAATPEGEAWHKNSSK